MKKKINLLVQNNFFSLIILLLCTTVMHSQDCNKYKVEKIDSTQNNYLVYLKASKPPLLVSPKVSAPNKDSKKIIISNKYEFCIYENTLNKGIPKNMSPSISIDGETIWKTGDKHRVAFTKQLAGLYYLGLKE
jgi:hypothetical protein